MQVLKLKSKNEYKYKNKHPWGFLEDFDKVPDSLSSAHLVEVRGSIDAFVSRGYINKQSKIFYRALTFDSREDLSSGGTFIKNRLLTCWRQRRVLGYDSSFRLCFSENDFLPGLIIDLFFVVENGKKYQVFVLQVLSFGMNQLLPDPLKVLKELVDAAIEMGLTDILWENTLIVVRNDIRIREKEGLIVSVPQILKDNIDLNLNECHVELKHFFLDQKFYMSANLYNGQKTGIFLDQNYNLLRTCELLKHNIKFLKKKKIRILDLCCHLGQWSIYLSMMVKDMGIECECVLVDISSEALEKASHRLDILGVKNQILQKDILENDYDFDPCSFDVVIVDPPAFVKNKLSIPSGKHAYQKINSRAIKWVDKDGLLISCSCSGLLSVEEFKECLQKSMARSYRTAKCVFQGGHAPDHPFLTTFPEGSYLKMLLHLMD